MVLSSIDSARSFRLFTQVNMSYSDDYEIFYSVCTQTATNKLGSNFRLLPLTLWELDYTDINIGFPSVTVNLISEGRFQSYSLKIVKAKPSPKIICNKRLQNWSKDTEKKVPSLASIKPPLLYLFYFDRPPATMHSMGVPQEFRKHVTKHIAWLPSRN